MGLHTSLYLDRYNLLFLLFNMSETLSLLFNWFMAFLTYRLFKVFPPIKNNAVAWQVLLSG